MDSSIKPLLETEDLPGGGSTDVADVSWNVPNINLSVTVAPKDTPWHSWAVVACGGMSIGHKGMIYASKAMAMTMVQRYTANFSLGLPMANARPLLVLCISFRPLSKRK